MADQEEKMQDRPDQPADDADTMARLREEIENLPVREHVLYMMHSLSTLAIARLGLAADAAARRDLGQARLAIDAFKALLAALEQVLPAAELTAHRGMLSQLHLAYAGAIGRGETVPQQEVPDAEGEERPKSTAARSGESAGPKKTPTARKRTSSTVKKPSEAAKKTSKPRKGADSAS
jgi:hypothetical protein